MSDEYDVVHAMPARTDKRGRPVDGQFDTVLVKTTQDAAYTGVDGMSFKLSIGFPTVSQDCRISQVTKLLKFVSSSHYHPMLLHTTHALLSHLPSTSPMLSGSHHSAGVEAKCLITMHISTR